MFFLASVCEAIKAAATAAATNGEERTQAEERSKPTDQSEAQVPPEVGGQRSQTALDSCGNCTQANGSFVCSVYFRSLRGG